MSFEYSKYTYLYTKTLQAIEDGYPLIVHEGGSSSSKTYSTMQVFGSITFADPESVITVVGQDVPNLKKGPIRDFKNLLVEEPEMASKFDYNKSERIYTNMETGSIIEFNSYDDEQDAKSGRRDYSFFNEANGIPFPVYDAIKIRTKKASVIDFNPNARFWAHERVLPDKENRKWFKSTFRNNPYIDEKIKQDLLSYEPTPENIERGTANEYKWKVYGLGEVGRLEGLVLPNFEVTNDWPTEYKWRIFGLDFGFTNDPTALVEIRYAHGGLYWKEHIYETGLTNPDIAQYIKTLGFSKEKVIADSAEPKSIEEIRRDGCFIKGAEKGKDSVNQGIDAIKRYPLYINADSDNLIEEFSSYTWKEDKDGNSTNKPIDKYNHCFVKGTKIETIKGVKPIEDINSNDFVLTRNGYEQVMSAGKTGTKETNTYNITCSIGKINVTSTSNHKVNTVTSWKPISDLKENDLILVKPSSMANGSTFTGVNDTIQKGQIDFTELFGSITMAGFQKAITFIMQMAILLIMILTTWSLSKLLSIFQVIRNNTIRKIKSTLRSISTAFGIRQVSGIEASKEGNGTGRTAKKQDLATIALKKLNVSFAEKYINLRMLGRNFVAISVNLLTEEKAVLMTLPKNVPFAEMSTKQTNTDPPKLVLVSVGQVLESNEGKNDVYDISVKNTHEYFANGMLVHNCIDAGRYALTKKLLNDKQVESFLV